MKEEKIVKTKTRTRLKALLFGMLASILVAAGPAMAGPVTLWGIDAEDGGVGGHGPISNYQGVLTNMLANVTNGGSGILVIGGVGAHTGAWWTALAAGSGHSVTLLDGAANITAQSFTGYALIGVASSVVETAGGGLTLAESGALNARAADIAAFVNAGGGLMGLSEIGLAGGWDYLGGLGGITTDEFDYSNITPTAAGAALGITNSLDICCWHNTFLTYPAFLQVLAVEAADNAPAVLGGSAVVISTIPEPSTVLLLGAGLVGLGLWGRKRMAK